MLHVKDGKRRISSCGFRAAIIYSEEFGEDRDRRSWEITVEFSTITVSAIDNDQQGERADRLRTAWDFRRYDYRLKFTLEGGGRGLTAGVA
jgi:hypothetical protein